MLLLLHYLMVALDCKSLGYLNPATLLPTLESRYINLLGTCRQAGTLRVWGSATGHQVLHSGSTEGNPDTERLWAGRLES